MRAERYCEFGEAEVSSEEDIERILSDVGFPGNIDNSKASAGKNLSSHVLFT